MRRRTKSSARLRATMHSQVGSAARAGSHPWGHSHSRTNTSWVMPSAAASSLRIRETTVRGETGRPRWRRSGFAQEVHTGGWLSAPPDEVAHLGPG
jgi:hypothetical protein